MRIPQLIFGIFIVFSGTAFSQTAAPLPPLGRGPILHRAPSFSQWMISVKNGSSAEAPQIPDQATKFDARTLVTKTGNITHEGTATSDGQRYEKGCIGNVQVTVIPGVAQPEIGGGSGGKGGLQSPDYSKSDFSGFDWISKKNYNAVATVAGVPCFVFHADVHDSGIVDVTGTANLGAPASNPNGAPFIPPTGQTAYIDQVSHLPVMLAVEGTIYFYQFQAAPSAPLRLPANVQAAIDQMQAVRAQAAAGPAAP